MFMNFFCRYRPLKLDKRSKVAKNIKPEFFENMHLLTSNHLINLESHSMPVFLFKKIVPAMREELLFKKRISLLAINFLKKIVKVEGMKTLIFVGLHARRGDRLLNWINGKENINFNSFFVTTIDLHDHCIIVLSWGQIRMK